MNDITSTITYDERIAVSAAISTPIVWKVSKIDNTNPNGIVHYTLAQERWNEHTDAFEYEDGEFSSIYYPKRKIVGIYADYYLTNIKPIEPIEEQSRIYGEITYSSDPEIRVGGSYKKFTIKFFDGEEEIKMLDGNWNFFMNGEDCSSLIETKIQDNLLKVKFIGDDSYIGSVITIEYLTDTNIKTSVDVEIIGL